MKKLWILLLITSPIGVAFTRVEPDNPIIQSQLIPVDKIIVAVDGPEGRHLICESELERVGIDGRKPTLTDLINEELIYQDALKHKIPLEDYAERYIRSIKKHHNIGDKEVNNIFAGAGLTPEEGRAKLEKMGANVTMVDIKVKSRIFISQSDIEKEFNEHPVYKEPRYQLEVAFIPFFSRDKDKQQEQYTFLLHQIEHNELDAVWSNPLWIKEEDLAEDKKFITKLHKNEISKPQRLDNGFEIYRLKDKKERRLVPFEKRYREILDRLREPKFKEVFNEYLNELYKNASIIYIDKSYEPRE